MDRGTLFATFVRHSGDHSPPPFFFFASASKGRSKQECLGSWERQRERGPHGSLRAGFPGQEKGRGAGFRPPEYAKQSHVRICRLGTTAGALLFLGQSEAKKDGGGESKKETQPRGGPVSPLHPQGWTLLPPPVSVRLGRGSKEGFEQGWHNASPQP